MSNKDVCTSVVVVCSPGTEGKVQRVDEICDLNANKVVAAEETIFALNNAGVYDVFTLSLAVNSPALSVDGGKTHNVLLTGEGDVYAWGAGSHGELGLGPKFTDMEAPGQVRCSTRVTDVACGDSHSCMIDSFGNVYAWGQNFSRQLGLYTKKKSEMPENCVIEEMVMTPRVLPFSIKHSVAKVACGAQFTLAVTKTGNLWSWGAGESGQLGTGRCKTKEVPSECVITLGGEVVKVKDAAAGYGHSCALTTEGKVVVWGLNKHGQLGTGDNVVIHEPRELKTDFFGESIYAKDNSTACVSDDGALYTWGAGAGYRLMHGDCSTVYVPKKVESLESEKVSQFVFSASASAVLIKTRLHNISPKVGMLKTFNSLEIHGCGFWPSSSIVVKFTKCPDPSEEEDDSDNPAALIPPRSCMGQLKDKGTIKCKPPRLTVTGYYDVSLAMDGKNFLSETQRIFVCTDPKVTSIENCLYDLRESEIIDVTMTCACVDEVGPGLDVYVRLVNTDNKDLFSLPMLAELLPEDIFAESENADGADMDDHSGAGSFASAGSFDQHEAPVEEVTPTRGQRKLVCRNVDIGGLKNKSGATLMLEPQLSRNSTDFAPGNGEKIICHEFTPTDAYPNCVPFLSQREIILRGSGFFPLGMQAAIAISTVVKATPIEEEKTKKKGGKKESLRKASVSAATPLVLPLSTENSVNITDGLSAEPSVASLASVGSFIMESESPAFHVMTVPVRFNSVSELAVTIPALVDFVRPGLKLPDDVPSVLRAQILFSLASDAAASLSKTEVEFFFYQENAIVVSPTVCRRYHQQSFSISGVNNWISFQPNAPKLIFSDVVAGFTQTVDVEAVPSNDGETFHMVCELPGNQKPPEAVESSATEGEEDGEEGITTAPPTTLEISESFLENPSVVYKNLKIELLLDGVSHPEVENVCSVAMFDKVDIVELANPLPKEGATKGATVSFVASGMVSSSTCVVRLRGVNDKHVDMDGTVEIDEETGDGTFSFQMPDTLEEIEVHVKGKEKSVFVDISIDGGATFDKSEAPILVVGKY